MSEATVLTVARISLCLTEHIFRPASPFVFVRVLRHSLKCKWKYCPKANRSLLDITTQVR